jgi:hypothetical protein
MINKHIIRITAHRNRSLLASWGFRNRDCEQWWRHLHDITAWGFPFPGLLILSEPCWILEGGTGRCGLLLTLNVQLCLETPDHTTTDILLLAELLDLEFSEAT